MFGQIVKKYQDQVSVEVAVLRDNLNPVGDTDYFKVAAQVQHFSNKIVVTSQASAETMPKDKTIVVVGHAPIEQWQQQAQSLDKNSIKERLGFNLSDRIVVYSGSYGDGYEEAFRQFLQMIQDHRITASNLHILIVPHPRYRGVLEKTLYLGLDENVKNNIRIVSESEENSLLRIKSLEALVIADVVVVCDATSTVVAQANVLKKKVLYINSKVSQIAEGLCSKNLIQRITTSDEMLQFMSKSQQIPESPLCAQTDVFQVWGIPREGARLLWEEFVH